MIYPQYITLTVTRVAVRNPRNPKQAQAQIMQPPVRQLFILPLMISKSQYGSNAEMEMPSDTGGQLISFAETFDDILEAIQFAGMHSLVIAKPRIADQIEKAAAGAIPVDPSPLRKIAEEMRNGTAQFVPPTDAERRAAEGAKHQDEIIDEPIEDPEAPRWDDFPGMGKPERGQLSDFPGMGEPAPEPRNGDLRVIQISGEIHEWFVEARRFVTGSSEGGLGFEWTREDVPAELRSAFPTFDQAVTAVRLAGYSRRLVAE